MRPTARVACTSFEKSTRILTSGPPPAPLSHKAFGKNEPQRHRDAEKTRKEKKPAGGVAIHPTSMVFSGPLCLCGSFFLIRLSVILLACLGGAAPAVGAGKPLVVELCPGTAPEEPGT